MQLETERIFRVLESFNAGLPDGEKVWNNPFLWDTQQQGEFNIWQLLVSECLVYSTAIDQAIKHWQDIESRGTVTAQDVKYKGYKYAPYWNERKHRVASYILRERADIYKALAYFLKQNLLLFEAYELCDYSHTEYDFRVCMILGHTLDSDWLCIIPTVPNQVNSRYSRSLYVNIKTFNSCKSENLNTQDLFEKVNKILARLSPISIYGYYGYTYNHQILCTSSIDKIKAISLGLQASGMFTFDESLSEIINFPRGKQVRQFMEETLQGCGRYTFSFWESAYDYYLGYIQTGDWLGFKHRFWSEYNP